MLFFLLFAAAGFTACQKESSVNNVRLEASKTTLVKKGEPVLLSLPQAPAGSTVQWTVSPSANTQISAQGNAASIKFGAKGTYTVSAAAGNILASQQIAVTDTAYTIPTTNPASNVPFSAGEKLAISLSRIDSGSFSGLVAVAITNNSYNCLNSVLRSSSNVGASGLSLEYNGVYLPADCSQANTKVSGFNYLYPIPVGTHSFSITVGSSTFTGSITRTATGYSISWPNSSVVSISPTTL